MTEKQLMDKKDFPIELTIHDFPAELLTEFASKIVKPYFKGNLNLAVRTLMEKSLTEEALFTQIVR